MRKILLVEDDEVLAIALRKGLESEGYAVETAEDGVVGLHAARAQQFDLTILDVMLPGKSGFEMCEQLRKLGDQTPIIMLTARGMEVERVQGLKLGADDYITKPFSLLELFARIEAVLRRTTKPVAEIAIYKLGNIELNFKTFEATKDGVPLELSPREFRILKYFIEHPGAVVSRDQLLNGV